jgi:hypothetical protein
MVTVVKKSQLLITRQKSQLNCSKLLSDSVCAAAGVLAGLNKKPQFKAAL